MKARALAAILAASLLVISQQPAAADDRVFLADNGRTLIVLHDDGSVEIFGTPSDEAIEFAKKLKRAQKDTLTRT